MTETNKVNAPQLADSFSNVCGGKIKFHVYAMLQCTDSFQILRLTSTDDVKAQIDFDNLKAHGLELRLFNRDGEVKWMRTSIADTFFYCRERLDDAGEAPDCYDEMQFLDIDTTRSNPNTQTVVTTGGGKYSLPIFPKDGAKANAYNDLKICIRNYLAYDEDTGRAYVCDWRMVGFAYKEGDYIG